MEPARVDDAADHLAHVVRRPRVGRDDVVELLGVLERLLDDCGGLGRGPVVAAEGVDDAAHDAQRVGVVVGEVVDDARLARVHVTAAEVLRADDLAGGRLHQRRSAEEDRALLLDDDGLVGHRRHVGAAGRARAHHRGDLRDALRREVGLVEEDPAEVVAVGEHLVLHRQEGAAAVDEVDAGQPVDPGHLLRPEVLLDRDGVVGAALDGGVVGDDDALAAADPADAGDDAGRGDGVGTVGVAVHPGRGQRAQLQERAARVEQPVDPLAREQLAAVEVLAPGGLAAALAGRGKPFAQVVDEPLHLLSHAQRLANVNLHSLPCSCVPTRADPRHRGRTLRHPRLPRRLGRRARRGLRHLGPRALQALPVQGRDARRDAGEHQRGAAAGRPRALGRRAGPRPRPRGPGRLARRLRPAQQAAHRGAGPRLGVAAAAGAGAGAGAAAGVRRRLGRPDARGHPDAAAGRGPGPGDTPRSG